jgi:hypothetical protein
MRIALSGIESNFEKSWAVMEEKVPSLLTSFYYAKSIERSSRLKPWVAALEQAEFRFVDSGGFTFRTNAEQSGDVDVDTYLANYIKWLTRMDHRGLIDCWVEMDIGITMGKQWVIDHRKKFIDAGLGKGLIQVWHPAEHTWDDWLELIEESLQPGRSRFVAIEGKHGYRAPLDYKRFIKPAYDRGVRVHGFKMTSIDDLWTVPFYSVDSTTWFAPVNWGVASRAPELHGDGVFWRGVLPKKNTTYQLRMDILLKSARAWTELERKVTAHWVLRGVDWEKKIREVSS